MIGRVRTFPESATQFRVGKSSLILFVGLQKNSMKQKILPAFGIILAWFSDKCEKAVPTMKEGSRKWKHTKNWMKDHTTLKMHVFYWSLLPTPTGTPPLGESTFPMGAWHCHWMFGFAQRQWGSGSSVVGLSTNGCKQMELWAAQSSKCSQKDMWCIYHLAKL